MSSFHFLSIRYGEKVKKFQWRRAYSPTEFVSLLANVFRIDKKILGLRDSAGNHYDISYFCERPDEIKNENYNLVVKKGDESNYGTDQEPSNEFRPSQTAGNFSTSTYHGFDRSYPKSHMEQYPLYEVIQVKNYAHFETLLQSEYKTIGTALLVLLETHAQFQEFTAKFHNILNDNSAYITVCFSVVNKEISDFSDSIFVSPPCFSIFRKNKKLMEMPLDVPETVFQKIMNRIRADSDQKTYTPGQPRQSAINLQETFLKFIEKMAQEHQLSEKDYYFLKYLYFEDSNAILYSCADSLKEQNLPKFAQSIHNFLDFKKARSVNNTEEFAGSFKATRPATADPKSRVGQGRHISALQERFIHLCSDLETSGDLNQQSSSIIKSLILEEHQETHRIFVLFVNSLIDKPALGYGVKNKKLQALVSKLGGKIERPQSPYRKDEKIQALVKQHVIPYLSDEEEIGVLNNLVKSEDEVLYSTFDVFESDRDEEELLDTVRRILNKHKLKREVPSSSHKQNHGNHPEKEKKPQARPQEASQPVIHKEVEVAETKKPEVKQIVEKKEQERKAEPAPVKKGFEIKPMETVSNSSEKKGKSKANSKPAETKSLETKKAEPVAKIEPLIKLNQPDLSKSENKMLDVKKIDVASIKHQEVKDVKSSGRKIKKLEIDDFLEMFRSEIPKQNIEITGMINMMLRENINQIKDILEMASKIEDAYKKVTSLASSRFAKYLQENFSNEDMEFIERTKSEERSQTNIYFLSFKQDGDIEKLKNNLKGARLPNKFLQPQKLNSSSSMDDSKSSNKESRYSTLANQRKINRKESFRIGLRTGNALLDFQDSLKKDEENEGMVVMLPQDYQDENSDFKEIMDKYYQEDNDNNHKKHLATFNGMIRKADFLNEEDVKRMQAFFDSANFNLLAILSKYEKTKSVEKVKKEIQKLLEGEDDFWQNQGSPLMKSKVKKLNTFKIAISNLLNQLKLITKKQFKLFCYLYMEEDISILSAFEVYQLTDDIQDFLENLKIVDRLHFFKSKLDFDEIEQFDEVVEHQLSLLYAYKKYLNVKQRQGLEKCIRAGDISMLKIYQDYKKHQSRENFINSLMKLATDKSNEIEHLEKIIKESKQGEKESTKRRETIENFYAGKFLKDCKYPDLVFKLVDEANPRMESVFEVYNMTKDKEDFIENIKILYKWAYAENLKTMIAQHGKSEGWPKRYFDFFNFVIKQDVEFIMGIYQLYMVTKDEADFHENLRVSIKFFKEDIKNIESFIRNS